MKKSYSKKLSLLICGLLISPFNYAAESTPSNYYQDAHGNFIGYTHDQYNSIYEGYGASLFRDGWSGLMDADGNLKYAGYPEHTYISTTNTYYKSTDCSGAGYFSLSTDVLSYFEPFKTEVVTKKHNKYNQLTVQKKNTIASETKPANVLSFSTLNADGNLVCEKTPYAILKQKITALQESLQNNGGDDESDEYLSELYVELRYTKPSDVAEIVDSTDITNKYSWMGFKDYSGGSVSIFVKGIDYNAGIEFVDVLTPPPQPEELTYVRRSHDLSVRVQSNGSIGSASITQGPDIKISQLFAVKKSTGIYEVNIPETFLPKNRSVKNLQLQCSINVGAASLIPNANIGCYKLSNQNKIRVVTTLNENYYNSDFSLNIKY
ncbi:hypothetical protein [Photobacterium sp. Alg240-V54]|uniref:hypothetical protein n=1 Tax=Photobacterium sp. Alg240-V54 TaxID=2305995 RepID=UPI0013D7A09C|nr:hypothetical protein [Photobacterium sp. Alg240-V54]